MKYLILLLLILSSCTDKENTNQESTTQDMLKSEKLQTNTKPLIAYYGMEPELFLLKDIEYRWHEELTNPEWEGSPIPYKAIYYNPINNFYYTARMEEITNAQYTIDTNKLTRWFPIGRLLPSDKPHYLEYAGSISLTQRIYFHPLNKKTYLKTLSLVTNTNTYAASYSPSNTFGTNQAPFDSLPYPSVRDNTRFELTNKQGVFGISYDGTFRYYRSIAAE